jgi:hypothetical protein
LAPLAVRPLNPDSCIDRLDFSSNSLVSASLKKASKKEHQQAYTSYGCRACEKHWVIPELMIEQISFTGVPAPRDPSAWPTVLYLALPSPKMCSLMKSNTPKEQPLIKIALLTSAKEAQSIRSSGFLMGFSILHFRF